MRQLKLLNNKLDYTLEGLTTRRSGFALNIDFLLMSSYSSFITSKGTYSITSRHEVGGLQFTQLVHMCLI